MASSNLEIKIKALIEGLDGITKMRSALQEVATGTRELLGGAQEAGSAMDGLATDLKDAASEMAGVEDSIQSTATKLKDLSGSAQEAGAGLTDIGGGATDASGALLDVASASTDTSGSLQDVGAAANDAGAGLDATTAAAGRQQSKLQLLMGQLKEIATNFTGLITGAKASSGSLDGLSARAAGVATRFRELIAAATGAGTAARGAGDGMASMGGKAGGAMGAIRALSRAFKPLLIALAAVAGIKLTFDYLKDAAGYAARVETLGVTLGVVGANAGYTTKELAEFEKQLKKGGISTESARDSMIQMMQAGIDLGAQLGQTTPQIVTLARAAQDLAVVTGENSSATLQRLVTNIQQMDTMGLRYMGLMVDMTAAQQKFAATLGTSAGALSNAQKRQAVLNEVMVQSLKMSGAYELSMETVGKKVSSMTRYTDELRLSIGNKLLPAYGAIVDAGTDLLKSLRSVTDGFDTSGDAGDRFGAGVKAIVTPLVPLLSKVYEWVLRLAGAFAPAFHAAGVAIGAVLNVVGDLLGLVGEGMGVMIILEGILDAVALAFYAIADAILIVKAGFNFLIGLAADTAQALLSPMIAVAEWLPISNRTVEGMKKAQKELQGLAARSKESMDEVTDHFLNGESHVYNFAESLYASNRAMAGMDLTPAQKLREDITALTRAQTANTLTSVQVAEAAAKIKAELDEASASAKISEKEFARLTVALGGIEKKMREELDEEFKKLKTSSAELASGISSDSATIIGALSKISENGLATSKEFAQAFSTNMSMAKNVQELNNFSEVLKDAKTRWPEASILLAQAQSQVALKFDEIYDKQLKALSTKVEWDTLRDSIVQLGEKGVLSVGQVEVALVRGEQAVNRLSPSFVAAARSSEQLKVAIAGIDEELEQLDAAIQNTATKAVTAYSNMAAGYTQLGEQVQADTSLQMEAIDRRYTHEVSLIDSSILSVANAEQAKLQALISSEEAKSLVVEESFQKQLTYLEQGAEAERAALTAKLATFDEEAAKVEDSLGKQETSRTEYARRMKELEEARKQAVYETEAQIREKKIATMELVRDRYQAHIDKLIAEEERHLGKVKDLEEAKAQAKMSVEERIRSIQKSGMSDYEAYQANMSDVASNQSKAREAASRGEFEDAKKYLEQANTAAAALNTTVKDGDQVLINKQQAAAAAASALREVGATQQDIITAEQQGHINSAAALKTAAQSKIKDLGEVTESLGKLRDGAAQETRVNISANSDQAKEKLNELDLLITSRERLIPLKVDLVGAQESLKSFMDSIEKGGQFGVMVDTQGATQALTTLKEYAERTTNSKLEMDTSSALASIENVKTQAVAELNSIHTASTHDIKVEGKGVELVKEVHANDGRVTTSTHMVETNAATVAPEVAAATTQKEAKSTHTVTSNAREVAAAVNSLSSLLTRSTHTIVTNVEAALASIMSLQGKNTSSTHTVYVTKVQANAEGGSIDYIGGGGAAKDYPYQSSGTIPGAGNTDSVSRSLDVGSFVLRKSAVQAIGASRILTLIEKAKNLPKLARSAMGRVKSMLMPGEILVGRNEASRIGLGALTAMNAAGRPGGMYPALPLHFANGGAVGAVSDFLRESLDVGHMGMAFEKGGPVPPQGPTNVVQVDLRGNSSRATVSVAEDQSENLLDLLGELRARSS